MVILKKCHIMVYTTQTWQMQRCIFFGNPPHSWMGIWQGVSQDDCWVLHVCTKKNISLFMVFQTQILMPISEEYTPLGKCNRTILAKNTKKQTSTLNFLINLRFRPYSTSNQCILQENLGKLAQKQHQTLFDIYTVINIVLTLQ